MFCLLFCLLAFYPVFCFISPEIKINKFQRNKKYVARNIIVNKTVAKEKKAKDKKQKIGNKDRIAEQAKRYSARHCR